MDNKTLSFDQAMQRLQQVVNQLDSADLSLEESLTLFEEGLKLSSQCNLQLKEFEEKIDSITDEYKMKEESQDENSN